MPGLSKIEDPLWQAASEVRTRAYAPYSKFFVGAAIETATGEIFTGANVENASYGGTVCAERIAIFKAVTAGFMNFKRIAIVADAQGEAVPPCGLCLQVIAEFCGPATPILLATPQKPSRAYTLGDLLPTVFSKNFLSPKPNKKLK